MTPSRSKFPCTLDALPTQTSLLWTRQGRPHLPPPDALNLTNGRYYFSDEDLHAILAEVRRQRRKWRVGHYLMLGVIAVFFAWCGWLLRVVALRDTWPLL